MKSKILKVSLFLVLQLVCLFAFVGCGSSTVIDSLKRHNIDTKLLSNYELACDIKGETFTGRAPCYGVIIFDSEPAAFLQSFSTEKLDGFSSEKSELLENEIDAHYSSLKIPKEYCPNWSEDYSWYVSGGIDQMYYADTLFMVYFPNAHKLIVLETGH